MVEDRLVTLIQTTITKMTTISICLKTQPFSMSSKRGSDLDKCQIKSNNINKWDKLEEWVKFQACHRDRRLVPSNRTFFTKISMKVLMYWNQHDLTWQKLKKRFGENLIIISKIQTVSVEYKSTIMTSWMLVLLTKIKNKVGELSSQMLVVDPWTTHMVFWNKLLKQMLILEEIGWCKQRKIIEAFKRTVIRSAWIKRKRLSQNGFNRSVKMRGKVESKVDFMKECIKLIQDLWNKQLSRLKSHPNLKSPKSHQFRKTMIWGIFSLLQMIKIF